MLPCIYKWVKGYEGLYIVNNYGSVISLCKKKPKIMNQPANSSGYLQISLCKKNYPKKSIKVHVLVGNTFIGERIDDLTFDHIDRVKTNNRADNLRLATKIEQNDNQDVRKNNKFGEKHICLNTKSGNEYYRIRIQKNNNNIDRCFSKKNYTWRILVCGVQENGTTPHGVV